MKLQKFLFLGLTILSAVLSSCEKDKIIPEDIISDNNTYENKEQMTVLGEKLENPYTVTNMQSAFDNLKSSGSEVSEIDIETTHYYIRFLPKNEEEFDLLKQDTILILYDIPLDYEIKDPGIYYHDPELPDTAITWQYCAVTVDKKLPEVYYEILADLYIPPTEDEDELKSSTSLSGFYENLEDEALRITNNLEDEESPEGELKGLFSRKSKWRPAGRIQVWDDNLNRYIGVEGVKVRARRWFTTHTGIANSNGDYSCNGRFRQDANYSIVWERHDFEIRKSCLGRAKYDGPKRTGNWDLQINNRTVKILGRTVILRSQKFYATIFRAAHHYYYKDIQGLRRPPQNSFWKTQLKIRAFDEENDDSNGNHAAWRRFLGLGSAVKIYNPQHNSRDIYATVIHELAHASHWNMGASDFNNAETIVKESWARGVQWSLTQMVYQGYRGGGTNRPYYTQVVVDMIDAPSRFDQNNGSEDISQDDVNGYTTRQIEDALKGKKTWDSWKENLKNKYDNETEENLDTLFEHWNN